MAPFMDDNASSKGSPMVLDQPSLLVVERHAVGAVHDVRADRGTPNQYRRICIEPTQHECDDKEAPNQPFVKVTPNQPSVWQGRAKGWEREGGLWHAAACLGISPTSSCPPAAKDCSLLPHCPRISSLPSLDASCAHERSVSHHLVPGREREMKFVVDASPLFHIPLISRLRRLPALSFATPVDSLSLPVAPTESHTHEGSCRDGSVLVGRERMHRTRFFGCRHQKNASAGKVEWFGTR